jgi:NAD(P)H-nitrite reductase large subunit
MCVMYSDILDAIKAGSKTFEDLSVELLVGTGCNSCVAEIEHVLKEELS